MRLALPAAALVGLLALEMAGEVIGVVVFVVVAIAGTALVRSETS